MEFRELFDVNCVSLSNLQTTILGFFYKISPDPQPFLPQLGQSYLSKMVKVQMSKWSKVQHPRGTTLLTEGPLPWQIPAEAPCQQSGPCVGRRRCGPVWKERAAQQVHTVGHGRRDQHSHSKTRLTAKGCLMAETAKHGKYRLLLQTPTRKF